MCDEPYKEYLNFFKTQFNSHPTETFMKVSVIDELIATRNEYQDKNMLDYLTPEEVGKTLKKLEIITFEEYINSKQKLIT